MVKSQLCISACLRFIAPLLRAHTSATFHQNKPHIPVSACALLCFSRSSEAFLKMPFAACKTTGNTRNSLMRLARATRLDERVNWPAAAMLITLRGFFFNVASRMNCANHMAPKSISKSSYNLADARCMCVFLSARRTASASVDGRGEEKD